MRPKNQKNAIQAGNFKLIRSLTGLSQTEFAGKLGLTKDQLQGYETNRTVPSPQTLIKICDIAGITLTQLTQKQLTKDDIIKEMFVTLNRSTMDSHDATIMDLKKQVEYLMKQVEQQNRLIELQNSMIDRLKMID